MALHGHLLALLVLIALAASAVANQQHGTSAPVDLVPAAPGASLAERARDDRHRHAYITSKLASRGGDPRRSAAEVGTSSSSSFSTPLSSGAYSGTGQFLARFAVGTPAQQFLLVADTGSDLTWVKCRGPGGASPPGSVFRPADSKSWATIPCSSDTCKLDVQGNLGVGARRGGHGLGDHHGVERSQADAGRRGAGLHHHQRRPELRVRRRRAQPGQQQHLLRDARVARFGGRFSYCLVDHLAPRDVAGYLTFGPTAGRVTAQTPLLLDPALPFYTVTVHAVRVAGAALAIPADVWDVRKNGGVILDSGTTLTVLAGPAYKAVVAALSKGLAGVPRISFEPFEYCYNWTARGPSAPEIPKLSVQFAGSALFEPPAKSYVIDAAPGVKCIGVQEGDWPGVSVFGNIMQQEHLWEFDLKNRFVRFMPSTCTK
ncbi:hypothetical protein EJB05_54023, partial [Eragrostis curvula]